LQAYDRQNAGGGPNEKLHFAFSWNLCVQCLVCNFMKMEQSGQDRPDIIAVSTATFQLIQAKK
jgi:hypothetical protein